MRGTVWIFALITAGCCGCPQPCSPPMATGAPEAPRLDEPPKPPAPDSAVAPSEALALLEEADQTFRSRKYVESRAAYERALAAAVRTGHRRVVVEALAQIARTYSIVKEGAKGRPSLERAGAMATPDEPHGWTRYLGVRGIFEREEGDKDAAVATFEAMYAYAMEKGLHKQALNAAHHVAIAAESEVQIAWAEKGIAAAEAMGSDSWLAVLWNNLGATYEDLKRYDEALAAYEKARIYHHKGKQELPKLIADWAVGHGHRLAGNAKQATEWITRTLAWAERIEERGAREWEGYCLEELGILAQDAGDKARALDLLTKASALFLEAGLDKHWPEHMQALQKRLRELGGE